jgi:hypothetical protein
MHQVTVMCPTFLNVCSSRIRTSRICARSSRRKGQLQDGWASHVSESRHGKVGTGTGANKTAEGEGLLGTQDCTMGNADNQTRRAPRFGEEGWCMVRFWRYHIIVSCIYAGVSWFPQPYRGATAFPSREWL